jgi:NAD-dependent SIR2 family protein deacetylase
MPDAEESDMYRSDGRRSKVECSSCGNTDEDLLIAVDPIEDAVYVGCPDCRKDVIRGEIVFGDVELSFRTDDLDELPLELQAEVRETLDDE